MKILKTSIAALILACTFQAASAQVSFGISFGTPIPQRRVIVRSYPYYREERVEPYSYYNDDEDEIIERYPVRRQVIVEQVPERTVYYRQGYYRRPVYFHNNYYRHEREHEHERFERRHW
jgi:hypothetical protein